MIGSVIWYVTLFGCAALFYCLGAYAEKREKPMWFWSGTEVDTEKISDVKQYNCENGQMWKRYSLWFWIAGATKALSSVAALVILLLSCTVGIALLVKAYLKIEKKYKLP